MELNYGGKAPLLLPSFFLFFSLILFNPITAICVPRNSTSRPQPPKTSSSSPTSHPKTQNTPSPPPVTTTHISAPTPSTKPQPENPSPPVKTPSSSPAPLSSSQLTTNVVPISDDNTQLNDLKGNLFTRSYIPFQVQPLRTIDPSLKKLCSNTDYPSLCVSSLTPYLAQKTDAVSALSVSIKATTQHAKLAIAAASKLAVAPGASAGAVAALGDCKESYNDALDNLQSAVDAVASKDIGTVNSMVSAVVTDSENCEDAFEGESLLFDYNDKLRKMASNALAIASLIN